VKRSPLRRPTPLRRKPPTRKRSYPARPDRATIAFHEAVRDRAEHPCWGCVVEPTDMARQSCRRLSWRMEAHHLLPQRVLRVEFPHGVFLGERDAEQAWMAVPYPGAVMGLPVRSLQELLDDPRNGVLVGNWHHARIENRRTIPLRAHLPADVWAFARELGVVWMLERWYPAVPDARIRGAA